jgi:short subunit dehydrogenase-like uncharacterized protein
MPYPFLLYGSYGYTGALIAEQAVQRGMRPLLAGRDVEKLEHQAQSLGLDWRAFPVEDTQALQAALQETPLVLHCAGPFHRTYQAMAQACLHTRRHYLDITGEIIVFEGLAALDAQARAAGVMLLPGAGFDVVPSDCLAAHLKNLLPSATHLALAIQALGGGISHGTALTMLDQLGQQGAMRQQGKLVSVPLGQETRLVDFGRGPVEAVAIPWGDVSTAYFSTGIPNIATYMAFPRRLTRLMRLGRSFGGLLRLPPLKTLARRIVKAQPAGPSAEARQTGRCLLWGEVSDAGGQRAAARLETPEGYVLTALTALRIAEKVQAGEFQPGFQTPSTAYGADFILEFENVKRYAA